MPGSTGQPPAPGSVPAAPAALLVDGERRPVGPGGLSIGRAEDNDVVLDDPQASRHHARLVVEDGQVKLVDLDSRHGTVLDGRPVTGPPQPLDSGARIEIGRQVLRFLGGEETRVAPADLPQRSVQRVSITGQRLSIGRDASNDLVLDDPNVSRFHAEIVRRDEHLEVVDLGSRNGTRVAGALVKRAELPAQAEIGIGPFRLHVEGESLVARDDHGALRLEARGVAIRIGDRQILGPTSVALAPGELVAIIGESGAGKSTLLKCLAGESRPSAGTVAVNGEPIASRLTDIGYVPQDDIVHSLLTVREALTYGARLRLPDDVADEEIASAVERVLGELALEPCVDQLVGSLSGGQRKRTSVATELLPRPSLLFLDEPTTGMDPGLETRMMSLFRTLADRSRGVMLVTHATKNLALCDRVVVMGRGGIVTFVGSPAQALQFFGAEDYDGIYLALEQSSAAQWHERFLGSEAAHAMPSDDAAPVDHGDRRPRGAILRQTRVLTARYLRLLTRDRRNLALLLGQAPVLAASGVLLFKSGLFARPHGDPGDAIELLFLLVITIIWLGAVGATREIVKERSVFERESAVGLRVSSYLLSKTVVLFGVAALQTILNAGVLLGFRPLHEALGAYLLVFGTLILTSWVAVWMGLLISAAATSEEQAISIMPLSLIPQLLFAGALVPVARMAEPVHTLSGLFFARWALASIGHSAHMNSRLAENPEFARVNRFGAHFFGLATAEPLLILAAFLVVLAAATTLLLRRRATA